MKSASLLFALALVVSPVGLAQPTITTQPASRVVSVGSSATLTVVAAGTGALTFQWRKEGAPVAGGTNAMLPLANIRASDAGSYDVVVANSEGSITSSAATVNIVPVDGVVWNVAANMPTARLAMGAGVAVVDGRISVIGHHDGNPGTGRHNERFDPATATWIGQADSPRIDGRQSLNTDAVVGQQMVLIGGANIVNNYHTTTVDLFNPITNTWTQNAATYPLPVGNLCTVVHDGKIWCFGGNNYNSAPYPSAYAFDLATATFTPKTALPAPRMAARGFSHQNKIWICGGYTGSSFPPTITNTVALYDPASDTWSAGPALPPAAAGQLLQWAGVLRNGQLVLVYQPAAPTGKPSLYRSLDGGGTWQSVAEPPQAQNAFGCAAVGDKVFLIGGGDPKTQLVQVVEFGTSAVDLLAGLVGYWPLDGNANDATSYANHGVSYGNVNYVAGRVGQAGNFDTPGSKYIEIGHQTHYEFSGSYSISLWFQPAAGSAGTIVQKHIPTVDPGNTFDIYQGTPDAPINYLVPNAVAWATPTTAATRGAWHHYAFVYSAGETTLKAYVDGKLETTQTSHPHTLNGNKAMRFMKDYWRADLTSKGLLDEVCLYNRALTAAEVGALSTGVSPLAPEALPAITTPPVAQTVNAGGSASFSVTATSSSSPAYQWRKGGTNLAGATTATLTLPRVQLADAGSYDVVVTNSAGSVTATAAILSVQTVIGWGSNTDNAITIPLAASGAIDVLAAAYHSVALMPDGTLVRWGNQQHYNDPFLPAPPNPAGIIKVSAKVNHVLALKADGTVLAWGKNNYGQSVVPNGLAGVVDVAAGDDHSLALKADGTVVHWGRADVFGAALTPPANLGGIVKLAAGAYHGAAIKADGTMALWGWTGYDPLPSVLQVPAGVSGIVEIEAGYNSNVVLKADGTISAWGYNDGGQISVPSGLRDIAALVSGDRNVLVTKTDRTVVHWGKLIVDGQTSLVAAPSGLGNVARASASVTHALALVDSSVPVILNHILPSASVGGAYSATLQNLTGEVVTWSLVTGALPPGLGLNGAQLAGTPTQPGTYAFVVKAAANGAPTTRIGYKQLAIAVSGPAAVPPTISAPPVAQTINAGGNVTFSVTATGTPSPTYQWRKNGLTISDATNATLALTSAKLTDAGNYDVVVSNATGSVISASAALTVNPVPTATPTIAARTFTAGFGVAEFTPVTAAGGTTPYRFSVLPALPAGLILNATTGAISGVPSAALSSTVFTITVTDANAATASSPFTLAINPSLTTAQVIASATLPAGTAATAFIPITATGGTAPYSFAIAPALPGALAVNATTGAISGTPAAGSITTTYTVTVSDSAGATSSKTFTLTVTSAEVAPTILTQPVSQTVGRGSSVAFSVNATGTPAPSYQWRKDAAAIAGATAATLALTNVTEEAAGAYTVTLTNPLGAVTSSPALLAIVSAQHSVVGPGYLTGATATITTTISYTGTLNGLGWSVIPPAGWTYASGSGSEGEVKPAAGSPHLLEWAWTTIPASPITFSYTLNVPAGLSGDQQLTALAIVRPAGAAPAAQLLAKPDPLTIPQVTTHSADTDRNFRLSLVELLRVIELYNTRNGIERTGAYRVDAAGEDGFNPEPTRAINAPVTLPTYHSADSDHNGRLSLFELTRVIELYNTRSGTSRIGSYHAQSGTEDGFAPGP